jgi:spheroidene monooxygenase
MLSLQNKGNRPIQTVTLSLHRFASPQARLWAFGQMGAARLSFRAMPEVGFWKLCGSGVGEGFTPIPNTAVWAILATWPDEPTARGMVAEAPVYRRWRDHAAEVWTVFLTASSARGKWSGVEPFDVTGPPGDGPLAVLTRATLRPRIAPRFWGHSPDVSQMIGADPDVIFKIGIGEVPWLQQVTFSIWPDVASMARFAHRDGAHLRAVRAVREGGWFREELYARFRILGDTGTWEGRPPLAQLERQAA